MLMPRVHQMSRCTTHKPICAISSTCTTTTRRQLLNALLFISLIPSSARCALETAELRGLADKTENQPAFESRQGVKIQEIDSGTGEQKIQTGDLVAIKYVLRRSNGYFIDASYGFDRFETFTFSAGSGQVVSGFDIGVEGMRVGGRRRFIIPPALGYVGGTNKGSAGPIPPDFGARRSLASHAKEPLIFEVQVAKIRRQ